MSNSDQFDDQSSDCKIQLNILSSFSDNEEDHDSAQEQENPMYEQERFNIEL